MWWLMAALASPGTEAEAILAAFADEPSVYEVQGWAASHARVAPEEIDRWLKSARAFAALPQLTVEVRNDSGWDQDWEYEAGDPALDQAGRDGDTKLMIRARWDLDQLVMSSERIRVIGESQDAARLREQVLVEVNRIYFARRRLQVAARVEPPSSVEDRVEHALEVQELTAALDVLTGGRFSRSL